jgi:phosphoribosylformylglycinamidine synthase subunit PurL
VPDDLDPFVFLFSESTARAIVAVPPAEEARFAELCAAARYPLQRIGVVDGGAGTPALDVVGQFSLPLAELCAAFEATFPELYESTSP